MKLIIITKENGIELSQNAPAPVIIRSDFRGVDSNAIAMILSRTAFY